MNQNFVPYNKELKQRARELRKNQTKAERHIWDKILKNKQFFWYKFTRQKVLDSFIADFYCSKLKLVVEIDWDTHFNEKTEKYDQDRTQKLNELWIDVIRYTNQEVLENIEWIYQDLKEKLIK